MTVSIPGKSYKATGITLKSSPIGESDRLLTILTKEYGLVRVITPGCRKPKSSLRAISSAFVTGELLIVKGRNLDKLVQADCRGSFPGLSRDLGKLTAAQYLAELVLSQALSEHPQEELFASLQSHLAQISQRPAYQTLPYLVYSIVTILVSAGVMPQLHRCHLSQTRLTPPLTDVNWQVMFDIEAGGAIAPTSGTSNTNPSAPAPVLLPFTVRPGSEITEILPSEVTVGRAKVSDRTASYDSWTAPPTPSPLGPTSKAPTRSLPLTAIQLFVLQHLCDLASGASGQPPGGMSWLTLDDLLDGHLLNLDYLRQQLQSQTQPQLQNNTRSPSSQIPHHERQQEESQVNDNNYDNFLDDIFPINHNLWLSLERLLRQYCHYHFDQPIRSAALIETCFPERMD